MALRCRVRGNTCLFDCRTRRLLQNWGRYPLCTLLQGAHSILSEFRVRTHEQTITTHETVIYATQAAQFDQPSSGFKHRPVHPVRCNGSLAARASSSLEPSFELCDVLDFTFSHLHDPWPQPWRSSWDSLRRIPAAGRPEFSAEDSEPWAQMGTSVEPHCSREYKSLHLSIWWQSKAKEPASGSEQWEQST